MSSKCLSDSSALSACGVQIGLAFIAQSACLSFIAVGSLLTYVSYIAFQNRRTPGWHLIRRHLDLYLLGLLLSDLIQAIGGIIDMLWIARAASIPPELIIYCTRSLHFSDFNQGVREGGVCTMQGVLLQFGDVGVALCSSAIAVHTFAELVLRWKEPPSFAVPLTVLCLYVIFLSLIVGIGYAVHRHDVYYGNTTYWCWITRRFLNDGIGLEYLWLWLAALVNLVLYIPVFLALKKMIIAEPSERWWRYRLRRTTPEERETSPQYDHVVKPRQMLFYPAVYILTVLPIAIARIPSLAHPCRKVPFPATVVSGMLFSASGIFNVIVYTSTRPALLRTSAATPDVLLGSLGGSKGPQLFWSDADIGTEHPASHLTQRTAYSASDGAGLHNADVDPENVARPPMQRRYSVSDDVGSHNADVDSETVASHPMQHLPNSVSDIDGSSHTGLRGTRSMSTRRNGTLMVNA